MITRRQRRAVLMAEVRESFVMAIHSILAHKLRSSLTLLGILVGVFSIIVVMTAIRALQTKIESAISELGSNTFQVQRWPAFQVGDERGMFEKYSRRKEFTLADAVALRDRATLAKAVAVSTGLSMGEVSSRYARSNPDIRFSGVTPEAFITLSWVVEDGRAIMQTDLDSHRDVCVLGNTIARLLFPHAEPLGEKVKFRGINYTVVGVLESKGSIFGQDQDSFMAVPITTGLDRFFRYISLDIQIQAYDQKTMDDAIEQVRGILRARRKVPPGEPDDFEIFSNDSLVAAFRQFTLAVRAGAAVISSIALIAAGIGIMNIMLVSVTERTREIGIRRAIGAKKRTIMTQFVLEAVALCQIGGIIGVLLGIAGGNVVAILLNVPPTIPVDWAIIGLLICSVVGVVFGTYPAYKAANLDPIESLRYE